MSINVDDSFVVLVGFLTTCVKPKVVSRFFYVRIVLCFEIIYVQISHDNYFFCSFVSEDTSERLLSK